MPLIIPQLRPFERKTYSQFGEDGIIARVAMDLGISQGSFFEFGIGPSDGVSFDQPLEGNFVLLREQGWKGVFLDGAPHLPSNVGVRSEFITALNINQIYRKHDLPDELDFMSIDVDGQEFWIWMSLMYKPKMIIIEYNGGLAKEASVTTQFDVNFRWDGSIYQGASLAALDKLGRSKGYTLVFANGVNAFFLKDELVSNSLTSNLTIFGRLFIRTHRIVLNELGSQSDESFTSLYITYLRTFKFGYLKKWTIMCFVWVPTTDTG